MPAELNISLDSGGLRQLKLLGGISKLKAAQALTFTAEKAVPAWRMGNSVFHRRNTWIDRGVRMRAATPANPIAQVGTVDKYMGRHIKDVDDPKEGRLFVPLYERIGDVKTHKQERSDLRRMERTMRKPFKIQINGDTWLARRASKAQYPLLLLGKIQEGAKVKPRLDALAIVDRVVQAVFPTVYERLLLKWAETGK